MSIMNIQIMQDLIDLNIFTSKAVTEQEYQNALNGEKNTRYIYRENVNSEGHKWFERVDTNNLSEQEIQLLLVTTKTKNIRTIKNVAIFFAVLTAISLAISIIGATSIANMF